MPTFFASTDLVGLEIVETARRAPRPRAQRAPVVGLAGLALVDEADDAARQARAVVGLNAAGVERRVAPAVGDQLLGRRRIAARLVARRRAAGPAAAAGGRRSARAGARPPPNIIITGTGPLASAGVTSVIWMSTVIAGIGRVVDVADQLLRRRPAGRRRSTFTVRVTRPGDLRHVLRHAAEHFAIEVLHDLRAPLLPPHRRAS